MKKLMYAAVVAFLFVGGLAAGVIHKGMQAEQAPADAATEGSTPALSLADLGASTPTEGMDSETLTLSDIVEGDASATPTDAAAAEPTPEDVAVVPDAGRTFGGGSNPDPVDSDSSSSSPRRSRPRSDSVASTASFDDGFDDSAPIPDNTVITTAPEVIEEPPTFDAPAPTPRRARATPEPTPEPVVAFDDSSFTDSGAADELPTVSDSGATPDPWADSSPSGASADAATASNDPWAAPASDPFAAAAPTPAPQMAMVAPSGGGDLVFGKPSRRPALVKVAQKQNGANSIVSIELAGSAPYKIIQIPRRRQVWVDFIGAEVPGGSSSVPGSASHIREISAKYYANSGGGTPIARVIVQLDDSVVTCCNERGKEELAVSPGRGTGEAASLQLTIGGKSRF